MVPVLTQSTRYRKAVIALMAYEHALPGITMRQQRALLLARVVAPMGLPKIVPPDRHGLCV
jgi:hypothetical protein